MLYGDIDFRNSSDTGEPEAAAIQPYNDGEPAGQGIFRRPVENTRSRSDVLRQIVREHVILQDFQPSLLSGGGTITFNRTVAGGGDGKFILAPGNELQIRPFATPGANAGPYAASTKASVLVGSVDVIKFESKYKQWQDPGADPDIAAEADMISVEIAHTGTLAVSVGGATAQPNNIYVTINYGTTTCQEVIDAVNAHTSANKLVVASLASGSASNPSPKFSTSEWGTDWSARFLRGGAPGLLHTISASVLATFFAASASNCLAKGDTLAIWYDDLVDLATQGGRLQSTPENSNYQIQATSLFNTRREPEKIPNCVPICKCIDDSTIVFVDGSRITYATPASLWWDSVHAENGSSSLIGSLTGWTRLNSTPCSYVPPVTVKEVLKNADDLFEAVLNGSQAFVSTGARPGITSTGNAGYPGVNGTGGGTSGTGLEGHGGAPNGGGVYGQGDGTGTGVYGDGGHAGGVGVEGHGLLGGAGVKGFGGASNADGVYGEGGGSGIGVEGKGGVTAGQGVLGTGGPNCTGVQGQGGSGSAYGGRFDGSGGGEGVWAKGGATAAGIYGQAGDSATAGKGVVGQGVGSGAGVAGTGGATGSGVEGQGGSTSGTGVSGTGGPNSTGVFGAGTGTGHGVEALGGDGATAYGVYATPRANTAAILGSGEAYNAHGVVGEAGEGGGYGVKGVGEDAGFPAVYGVHPNGGHGVYGSATSQSAVKGVAGSGAGVEGSSTSGAGVLGTSSSDLGVKGNTFGHNTDQWICVPVPMTLGLPRVTGGVPSWNFSPGQWECTGSGILYFEVELIAGLKLHHVYFDWTPGGAGSMNAYVYREDSETDHEVPVVGPPTQYQLRSAGAQLVSSGTSRVVADYVCDQNNTGFNFVTVSGYVPMLRFIINGNNSGDRVHSIYLVGYMRSVNQYGPTKNATT